MYAVTLKVQRRPDGVPIKACYSSAIRNTTRTILPVLQTRESLQTSSIEGSKRLTNRGSHVERSKCRAGCVIGLCSCAVRCDASR